MKNLYSVLVVLCIAISGSGQIEIDNTLSAEDATTQYFLTNGVFVSNVTFVGDGNQIGSFDCVDCNLGIATGLVMASGNVDVVIGPNNSGGMTLDGGNFGQTDADLELLIPEFTVNDAAVLEFDFIATGDSLAFQYVFGSEEYTEWVNSSFNDVFGFFISGPGIDGPYSNGAINIALIPETEMPVSIDNVNTGLNAEYYVDNEVQSEDDTQIQMDGFTVPLTAAIGQLVIGETYHIKLAVADAGDTALDTFVSLSDDSFVQFCSETVDFMPDECLVGSTDFDFQYTVECGTINLQSIAEVNIETTGCFWDMGDGTIIEGCMGIIEHEYDEAGDYQVSLVYEYGDFQAMEIKNIYINDDSPVIPIIDYFGESLWVNNWDGISDIQWYLDGILLEGETEEVLENPVVGTYSATFVNGCLSISEDFNVNTGIHETPGNSFSVYPNPSAGQVNIVAGEPGWLMIYDGIGKLIETSFVQAGANTLEIESPGAYVLRMTSADLPVRVIVR